MNRQAIVRVRYGAGPRLLPAWETKSGTPASLDRGKRAKGAESVAIHARGKT